MIKALLIFSQQQFMFSLWQQYLSVSLMCLKKIDKMKNYKLLGLIVEVNECFSELKIANKNVKDCICIGKTLFIFFVQLKLVGDVK